MSKRGFISTIVLIIVAIVLLKVWFKFDIFKWLTTPAVKSFFLQAWDFIVSAWDNYLKQAFHGIVDFFKNLSH